MYPDIENYILIHKRQLYKENCVIAGCQYGELKGSKKYLFWDIDLHHWTYHLDYGSLFPHKRIAALVLCRIKEEQRTHAMQYEIKNNYRYRITSLLDVGVYTLGDPRIAYCTDYDIRNK